MIKKLTIISMMALATSPLMGQSAKEVADDLAVPAIQAGDKKLQLPKVPTGTKIEFGGADYEQIIGKGGKISQVISDTPVLVYFRVTKDGQTVDSKDYEVVVKPEFDEQVKKLVAPPAADANPKPSTIPAILQWVGRTGEWKPGKVVRVYANAGCMGRKELKAFCNELRNVTDVEAEVASSPKEADIVLSIFEKPHAESVLLGGQAEGQKEAYLMNVKEKKVTITGATPAGVYMGTRTLLQILASKGAAPCGTALDFPRYAVRGCMFDIARTPFSLNDLRELVNLMAWYKMNDLHLVINNNYIFHENYTDKGRDPFKESYSAFRLESKMKGKDGTPLTAKDLSYTKAEFRELIDYARARGVNIVPEIDTPGHALSFTRVRPDLIYRGPMRHHPKRFIEMLDANNPETLKFVSKVFDEYLTKDDKLGRPVFEDCVVHVGSDEFFGEAEAYRKYTNGILNHVLSRGYTPRVWGSLSAKPGKTAVVSKGVQMNIWSKDWMLPQEAVNQGYNIINTFDRDLYIVPFANYYRMDRNLKGVYENWLPNKMWNQQLPAGHPQLLGATFAVWNDMTDLRHRGYGMPDLRELLSGSMETLSARLWGTQKHDMPFAEHRQLGKTLSNDAALTPWSRITAQQGGKSEWNKNSSGNQVNTNGKNLAVYPSYHLIMEDVKLNEATPGKEQVLLSGGSGVLLGVMKDGTIGFRRADGIEFSWDAKLPEGQAVKLELIGTLGKTRLLIDGKEVEKMTLNSFLSLDEGFQKRTKDIISTFVLPLNHIGAMPDGSAKFRGNIGSVSVQH